MWLDDTQEIAMPKGEYCQVAVMAGEAIIAEFYTPLGVKKEFRDWRDQRATLEKAYVSWRKTREWQQRYSGIGTASSCSKSLWRNY
jgi:hypothetical protein